jgi:hypothetical protein
LRNLHASMGTGSGGLGTRTRTRQRTRNRLGGGNDGGSAGMGGMGGGENRGFSDQGDWGSRRLAFEDQGWSPGAGNPFQDTFEPLDFDQMRGQRPSLSNAWHGGEWQNAMSDWRDNRPQAPAMGANVQDWVAQRPEIAQVLENLRARYMGGRYR